MPQAFNLFLSKGNFPSSLKDSRVSPGAKNMPSSYFPIPLIPVLGKPF